jgi:hypothetical protein
MTALNQRCTSFGPVKTRRAPARTADVVAALVLGSIITSGAIAAAVTGSASAHADPIGSSVTSILGGAGAGNNTITSAIAQVGQAFCPLLVEPGSNLASGATQAGGYGGLAPTIVGAVAGMAIKAQCANAMTQLANGDFGPLLQLMTMINPSMATSALPGAVATQSLPFALSAIPNS